MSDGDIDANVVTMANLKFKPFSDLAEDDLVQHGVWVAYYEPDELDLLSELGFERASAEGQIRTLEHPDEYVFPVPSEGASMDFKYKYLRAEATSPGGSKLVGYFAGGSLGIFKGGDRFIFNPAMESESRREAGRLAHALGEVDVLPLHIIIPATGRTFDFKLG